MLKLKHREVVIIVIGEGWHLGQLESPVWFCITSYGFVEYGVAWWSTARLLSSWNTRFRSQRLWGTLCTCWWWSTQRDVWGVSWIIRLKDITAAWVSYFQESSFSKLHIPPIPDRGRSGIGTYTPFSLHSALASKPGSSCWGQFLTFGTLETEFVELVEPLVHGAHCSSGEIPAPFRISLCILWTWFKWQRLPCLRYSWMVADTASFSLWPFGYRPQYSFGFPRKKRI